ncbi:MAG: response regulator transcription factor [Hydrotalea sp.]|jgi:DNA-binding response OmpR family regulator|nr:response regulator transcription factor [Hydrotalea sp.]
METQNMQNPYKILLLEDERMFSETVRRYLTQHGFDVEVAFDADQARKMFAENPYQVLLLDVYVPGDTGIELCRSFREVNSKVPIILLSSSNEMQNKMDAFSLGADDFIIKPVSMEELLAKVKVFIKRTYEETTEKKIVVHDLEIDTQHKSVKRQGQEIQLTAKEYALLLMLAKNKGVVVSKHDIMEKVWDLSFDTGTNSIEVYINFLRKKIDRPFDEKLIHTKPGFGYYIK